jgi:hypothetical protein
MFNWLKINKKKVVEQKSNLKCLMCSEPIIYQWDFIYHNGLCELCYYYQMRSKVKVEEKTKPKHQPFIFR